MVAVMDERVRQLEAQRISGPELIYRMANHLPDLQRIWTGANNRALAMLCQEYPGF